MMTEYPPVGGGGATVCEGLFEAYARRGHDIDIVTSGMKDLAPYEERNGVRIHRVRCWRMRRDYSTAAELLTQVVPSYRKAVELSRKQRYDVNHCHFVVPSGLVSYFLARRIGLPYLLTAHGSDIPGYNPDRFQILHRLIRPGWSRIIRGSQAITAPSRFLADMVRSRIDVPVSVLPNGFNPPPSSDVARKNRILLVSRMVERKGIQHFLRALEGLETDWEVWIAGDGPYLPALKELAARSPVPVEFLGLVSREKLFDIYRSSRIFVFPSIQENFPMVLLEAMSAGCAVVTTSAWGCAEVVEDAALQVETESADALRGALKRLLSDEREIECFGIRAQERAARFTWDKLIPRYEELLRRASRGEREASQSGSGSTR